MSMMNMFGRLRTHYDVPTTLLALYAEMSTDTLHSVSMGRRTPKLEPLWAFIKLEQALSLDTPVEELSHAKAFMKQQEESRPERFAKEIKKLERTIVRHRETLEDLKPIHDRLLRGLHACNNLLATDDLTTHQRDWLLLRQDHINYKLTEKPFSDMPKLEAKIDAMELEVKGLRGHE